jgi:hypothetical protein
MSARWNSYRKLSSPSLIGRRQHLLPCECKTATDYVALLFMVFGIMPKATSGTSLGSLRQVHDKHLRKQKVQAEAQTLCDQE